MRSAATAKPTVLLVCLGVLSLLAPGHAQEPAKTDSLVTRGRVGLNLAGAERLIAAAKEKAVAMKVNVNIAVVDDGGHLLAFVRMDSARPASAGTAITKAIAAATTRVPTGPIRRGFTPRGRPGHHDGLDIRARAGTAVRAVAAGKVIFAGEERRQFGKLVVVDHGAGWHSAYGFLSRITVKRGETVRPGERLGLVGRTGLAKGDELHFELRRDNRPVDPAAELPAR